MKKKLTMGIVVVLVYGLVATSGYLVYRAHNGNSAKDEVNKQEVNKEEVNNEDDMDYSKYLGQWSSDSNKITDNQIWNDGNYKEALMILDRVTAESLYCSTYLYSEWVFPVVAKKQDNGEYIFIYGIYQGSIQLMDDFIRVNIEGVYSGDYKCVEQFEVHNKCELSDYMIDYEPAMQKQIDSEHDYIELTQDYSLGLVVKTSITKSGLRWYELDDYKLFGVDLTNDLEDCNKAFGKSYSKKETEELLRVSYVKDKYLLSFDFNQDGEMVYMNCTYADEEKELGLMKKGDFNVRGTQIVNYIGGYEEEKTVVIPEGITEIVQGAFSVDGSRETAESMSQMKAISVCIPKNVAIQKQAFGGHGPIHITFEEGREYIDEGALSCMDSESAEVTVKLPSTIKELKKDALSGAIEVELNEGLEVIGERALAGVKCELPSTVKILGDSAMDGCSGYSMELPEGLEEIGNDCFVIYIANSRVTIPASVKRMGENPIRFSESTSHCGVNVDKNNKYYKSSKEGWLYTKDGKKLLYASCFKGDLIVPEGVEYVGVGSLNLDPDGESGPQKIILPKSLKKYNFNAMSSEVVVFQGEVPEFNGDGEIYSYETVFDVPNERIEEYKEALEEYSTKITVK